MMEQISWSIIHWNNKSCYKNPQSNCLLTGLRGQDKKLLKIWAGINSKSMN